jgi:hypothetical protein
MISPSCSRASRASSTMRLQRTMSKQTIALVGGTGRPGTLIGNAVLDKPDVQLRLLVGPGSRDKAAGLEKRGAHVVEGGIGPDAGGALASLSQGASAVISAVQGGPDVIIDGQTQLLRAARDAGVKRFIPSDYSLDLFKVKPGPIPTSEWRRQFASVADAERGSVEVIHLLNGGFLDRRVLPLMYYRSVLNGEGKLDQLMNDRYPSIRPSAVREYLANEGLLPS